MKEGAIAECLAIAAIKQTLHSGPPSKEREQRILRRRRLLPPPVSLNYYPWIEEGGREGGTPFISPPSVQQMQLFDYNSICWRRGTYTHTHIFRWGIHLAILSLHAPFCTDGRTIHPFPPAHTNAHYIALTSTGLQGGAFPLAAEAPIHKNAVSNGYSSREYIWTDPKKEEDQKDTERYFRSLHVLQIRTREGIPRELSLSPSALLSCSHSLAR